MNAETFPSVKKDAANGGSRAAERYFWVSFFLTLLCNQIPFQGARLLVRNRIHYCLELPIDPLVPFLPWSEGQVIRGIGNAWTAPFIWTRPSASIFIPAWAHTRRLPPPGIRPHPPPDPARAAV